VRSSPEETRKKTQGHTLWDVKVEEHAVLPLWNQQENDDEIDEDSRWPPLFHCGHNPFLMAHLVEDLQVEMNDDWTETATGKDVRSGRRKTFTTKR